MRWITAWAFGVGLILLASGRANASGSVQFVTGYTCDVAHGQPYCGATASGAMVGPGMAACPPNFAFGTPILVHFPDGDATFVCTDRGPVDHWDLWWPTLADCYAHTGYFAVEVG